MKLRTLFSIRTGFDLAVMRLSQLLRIVSLAFAFLIVLSRTGNAVDLYWDVNGAAAGSGGPSPTGTWGTNTKSNFTIDPNGQTGVNVSTSSLDNVHFSAGSDATGPYTVTMSGSREVNSIFFEEGTVIISPNSSSQTLTITSAGSITNSSGHQATINTNLVGTTSFSVLGANDLSFQRISSSAAPFTMNIGVADDGSNRTVTLNETSGDSASRTNSNLSIVVNSGTLLVNRDSAFSAAPGGVTVNNSGTTFGGIGVVGAVTINAGAILNPGLTASAGTLGAIGTLRTGALTLQSGSFSNFDVSGTTSFDKLISTGTLTLSGTLDVNIASGLNFTAGQILTLFTGTSETGNFMGIADGQLVNFDGYNFLADYTATGFNLEAVPEPSTWAAAALSLAFIGFTQRRRFQKLARVRA